jgi:hypothetical protein
MPLIRRGAQVLMTNSTTIVARRRCDNRLISGDPHVEVPLASATTKPRRSRAIREFRPTDEALRADEQEILAGV